MTAQDELVLAFVLWCWKIPFSPLDVVLSGASVASHGDCQVETSELYQPFPFFFQTLLIGNYLKAQPQRGRWLMQTG